MITNLTDIVYDFLAARDIKLLSIEQEYSNAKVEELIETGEKYIRDIKEVECKVYNILSAKYADNLENKMKDMQEIMDLIGEGVLYPEEVDAEVLKGYVEEFKDRSDLATKQMLEIEKVINELVSALNLLSI